MIISAGAYAFSIPMVNKQDMKLEIVREMGSHIRFSFKKDAQIDKIIVNA